MSQNTKDYGASVGASLDYNNTYMPGVNCVRFSTFPAHGKNGRSVLRTTVTFADGTFVHVVNSAEDKIALVKGVAKKGKSKTEEVDVQVASPADKERAVLYAIVKRLLGVAEKGGEIKAAGFGNKLGKLVAEADDVNVRNYLASRAAEEEKAKAEKKKAKAKARRDRRAAKETAKTDRVDRLCDAVEKLAETMAQNTGK